MTREEAIKIIDCYDIGFYDLSGEKIPADKLADAFDMAIEALSEETSTIQEKHQLSEVDTSTVCVDTSTVHTEKGETMSDLRLYRVMRDLDGKHCGNEYLGELVTCKDCRYYEYGGLPCPLDVCETLGDNGFCSRGERVSYEESEVEE